MVNCFLVCSPNEKDPKTGFTGYRISASKLDFRRLNKETVESEQILNLVESFHVLGKMFNDPVPTNSYECYDWIRKIKKKYDSLTHILFLHQGKYTWYAKDKPKPKKLRYDEKYSIETDGTIIYKENKYAKYSLVLPGDNFFSLGFYSHPIVIMYLNYPDSLKAYLNDHIDEFLARGGKPEAVQRKCKIKNDNIEHPPWSLDPKFHENHKAALLTKELARKEPAHYINFRDFKLAYNSYVHRPIVQKSSSDFPHYMWPYSQDREQPLYPN